MKVGCSPQWTGFAQQWLHGCEWVEWEPSAWINQPSNETTLGLDGWILPLNLLPFRSAEDGWVPCAISDRMSTGIIMHGAGWEQGKPLWLPFNAHCAVSEWDLGVQLLSIRPDVQLTSKDQEAQFSEVAWYDESTSEEGRRVFHPAELTPPSGYGVLALVCPSDHMKFREWSLAFHHQATAELTNVERSWKKSFPNSQAGGMVIKDQHHRFHFHFYHINDGVLAKGSLIQSSWKGLVENAKKYLSQNT